MTLGKAIKEYLDLVKNGIKNRDQIIEGIRNAAAVKEGNPIITDEMVAEIMRRKDICAACPFNSEHAKKRGYESSLPFQHCTLCKCRIGAEDSKEYCLSCECGMKAWNLMNPDLPPMELKWKAFIQTENKNQENE